MSVKIKIGLQQCFDIGLAPAAGTRRIGRTAERNTMGFSGGRSGANAALRKKKMAILKKREDAKNEEAHKNSAKLKEVPGHVNSREGKLNALILFLESTLEDAGSATTGGAQGKPQACVYPRSDVQPV